MLTAGELKAALRTRGLRLTKRLGQHHLIDARVIQRLVDSCQLSRQDTVIDVGAGLGALTEPLAQRAGEVLAVEVDPGMASLLTERMRGHPNVRVLCEDILAFAWERAPRATVVGAIPYVITSPLLVSLCEHRARIPAAWLLLQREVAQRLVAQPGTKSYGRLSVLCQFSWRVSEILRVPRQAFFPQPQVDSAWVQLRPWPRPPVALHDEARFFALVKAAFAQRRKTLKNCLVSSGQLSRSQVEALFVQQGLAAGTRGEQLSLEQFADLSNSVSRLNSLR